MSPRASSKKTRIETGPDGIVTADAMGVRGQVPRKQGLKPQIRWAHIRGSSSGPRASPKKTRIETSLFKHPYTCHIFVRGQVPRKQGLKLDSAFVGDHATMSEGKFQENKD